MIPIKDYPEVPRRTFPWVMLTILTVFWFITQFISGITSLGASTDTSGGVAVWAHVGAFIAGLILVLVMHPRRAQPAVAYRGY